MTDISLQRDDSPAVDEQVESLLRQLSLEEKIDPVSGKDDVAGRPNLIEAPENKAPPLALVGGPAGGRLDRQAALTYQVTAPPAPTALAATWQPDLARLNGDIVGAEMPATGHNVKLGPSVDLVPAQWAGRPSESFGEDPRLQARPVVPESQAMHAHLVQACIEHFLANNQKY
jgi:beta-glucosidase